MPPHFKVLVYVREVWSNSTGQIVTAPVPNKVIDKGLPGPGLLTQVPSSVQYEMGSWKSWSPPRQERYVCPFRLDPIVRSKRSERTDVSGGIPATAVW